MSLLYLYNWPISYTTFIFLQAAPGFIICIYTLPRSPSNTMAPLGVERTYCARVKFHFFPPSLVPKLSYISFSV